MCQSVQGHIRTAFNEHRTNSRHGANIPVRVLSPQRARQGPEFATYIRTMARLSFVLAGALTLSAACGANTATQEPVQDTRVTPEDATTKDVTPEIPAAAVVPENPADRGIRRSLNLAIARDAGLKERDISFIVTNGDVSVTGAVQSEEERKKITELAMNIDGVKSVANALRVAEEEERRVFEGQSGSELGQR